MWDIDFVYDRLGRKVLVTDAAGVHSFTYNDRLQLESEGLTGKRLYEIRRKYDDFGREAGFELDEAYEVTYGYDDRGRFEKIDWNIGSQTGNTAYRYLEHSDRLAGMETGSGLSVRYDYEPHRDVRTAVTNTLNEKLISRYEYQYDRLGRRINVRNSGEAFEQRSFWLYGYNDRNEVTTASRFTGENLSDQTRPVTDQERVYRFDPIGNRIEAVEGDNEIQYQANSLNQYETILGSVSKDEDLSYDEDGNLVEDGRFLYTWNAENRLVAVEPRDTEPGTKRLEFVYDYMGRRVRKEISTYAVDRFEPTATIHFVYNGWNLIKEIKTEDKASVDRRYVWGLDLSQSLQGAGGVGGLLAAVDGSLTFHYTFDANGNVGQLIQADGGGIAAHYEYDPFGESIGRSKTVQNSFRFSTKYFDSEYAAYYYGYRYYSPKLGRWMSKEPLGEKASVNLHAFILNNGINLIDKEGLAVTTMSETAFFQGLGLGLQTVYEDIEYSIKDSIRNLGEYLRRKFDLWAEETRLKGSFQVQDRNKFGIGKYLELNWGLNAKVIGSACKTTLSGGAFGGLKIEIPLGLSGLSLAGGGSVSGQLVSEYYWLSGLIKREGLIKLTGYAGVRYGWGVVVFGSGGKFFLESGVVLGVNYNFDSGAFEEFKVGVYGRAVADVGVLHHVVRHEYKWTFGGDPGIF